MLARGNSASTMAAAAATPPSTSQKRVIFVLNQLEALEATFDQTAEYGPVDLATIYFKALDYLVNCDLRDRGILESVFIKFASGKLFLLDLTQPIPSVIRSHDHDVFAELFENGVLVNHDTQQEYCREITGFDDHLPDNSRIIAVESGCVTGPNMVSLERCYMHVDVPDSEPLVLVIGRGAGLEIEDRISLTIMMDSKMSCITWIGYMIALLRQKLYPFYL